MRSTVGIPCLQAGEDVKNSRQCISAWRRVGHQLLKDWTQNDDVDTGSTGQNGQKILKFWPRNIEIDNSCHS
jgi:hypothetical protein